MKVGMISSHPPLNDSVAKIYTYNLIKNCPVDFVKIGCKGSKADYVIDFKSFSLKNKLKEIIKKEKLDLLHIQYIAPLYGKYTLNLNLLPVYKLKIPIVTTLHEVQYPFKGNVLGNARHKILEFIEGRIVKNSTKVIVHTHNQKKFLEKKHKAKNVEVIHTGLYTRKNKPKKSKNLIFFGIISLEKGIEYLISAMKYLEDFRLIIGGSTPNKLCKKHLRYLKKEIIANQVGDRIEIISKDWISDSVKDKIYRKSSIAIIPYTWGPYNSGIVQDAAEYNIPVVITRVGAIYDVVEKYRVGEIVKPKDAKKIANGVKKVYAGYCKYKNGIDRYRKEADWKATGRKLARLYKYVLN